MHGIYLENTLISVGVKDSINSFIVANDKSLFADKIIEALKDKNKLKKIGQQARKDFTLTWDETVEKYLKIVNK